MMSDPGRARARRAPGRFLLAVALLALTPLSGCRTVAGTSPSGAAAAPEPVLEVGALPASDQDRAAVLFAQARDAYESARWSVARGLAGRIVEAYPRSTVSGRALLLLAEASLADRAWDDAAGAAARYAELLPASDPRSEGARLIAAEAHLEAGRPRATLEELVRLTAGAPEGVVATAREFARRAAAVVEGRVLAGVADGLSAEHPLAPVVFARLSFLLAEAGERERATETARAALAAGAAGVDSLVASGVLNPVVRRVRVGTVLPLSGSPALQTFATEVAEGIAVAVSVTEGSALEIELVARDDGGDAATAARLVRELEEADAVGVIGFLQDAALETAGQGRTGALPLVSPTARSPQAGAGVYSLAGPDPQAAAAVARYAAAQGYERVAIIHSRAPESAAEADAFEGAARAAGLPVVGRYAYDVGATFFQDQIRAAREGLRMAEIRALGLTEEDTLRVEELDPVALVLPIPPEDVEFLAPQVTFFGLDTLGIQILGTSGWTDREVLEQVDSRHTTGVVATSPVGAGPGSSGYRRFREGYEALHRRSLVSAVPALGYDAGLVLLEAVRSGARSPAEFSRALETIDGLEGATGVFYVRDGRVLRRQEVVRILNRALVPAR